MTILDDILAEESEKEPSTQNVVDKVVGEPVSPGLWATLADIYTGDDRQTRATDELPSVAALGIDGLYGDGATFAQKARASIGLMTERDPLKQIEIIKANYSGTVGVQTDEKGNFLISLDNKTPVLLNRPGFSTLDALQTGGEIAAFTPAARAGGFAVSSLAAGFTQATLEAASALSGSGNTVFEAAQDSATTGVIFGAFNKVFEGLGPLAAPIVNYLKNSAPTRQIRDFLRGSLDDAGVTKAAEDIGLSAEDVTDVFIEQARRAADDAAPSEVGALALEREFDAPILTQGQRTMDQAQLAAEDSMRVGTRGEDAQKIMLGAEQSAERRLNEVAGEIQENIAGQAPLISTRQEAGAALLSGTRSAERVADDAVAQAYSEVGDAALTPDGYKRLLQATRSSIRGLGYPKSETLAPATSTLLGQIKAAEKQLASLEAGGARLKPQHIRQIELVRREIRALENAAANPTDARNVATMRRAFDQALDDAVQQALFAGDQQALAALKGARGLSAEYFKKFTAQDKTSKTGRNLPDRPGRFIEQIVDADPTDEQVINALFTANGFNNQAGAKMAQRFKEILGGDSPEWGMVRQAAFKTLVRTNLKNGEEVISGQQSLKALNSAMERNASLMREIFSPDEIAQARRFFTLVKRSQPDLVRSRQNPSGTAATMIKEGGALFKRIGLATGDVTTMGTFAGLRWLTEKLAGPKAAREAVRPFKKVADLRPLTPGAASGAIETGRALQSQERQE